MYTPNLSGIRQEPAKYSIASIKAGLPYAEFRALADDLAVTPLKLAQLLGIPSATHSRRVRSGTLSPSESDAVMRVRRVMAYASQVLGSQDRARQWFHEPNAALGEVPLNLLDTALGIDLVLNVLQAAEYAVYS